MKHHAALALLVPALSACAPTYLQDAPRVVGRVTTASNNMPIAGARIYYETRPEQVVQTNIGGFFDFPAVSSWHTSSLFGPDRFNLAALVVEAPGYVTTSRPIPINGPQPYNVQFYMQKAPE
jgi:hypothetical protein